MGGADAVRVGGHRRHEEPRALAGRGRQGHATKATSSRWSWRTSRYAARDGADAVIVDYESLPAVVDIEDAASDRVVIHEDAGTNKSYTWTLVPDPPAVDAGLRIGGAHRARALHPATPHP